MEKISSNLKSGSLTVEAYLIGHFSKSNGIRKGFSSILMDYVLQIILECQNFVGGRIVYLECENKHKIKQIYENFGFKFMYQYNSLTDKKFDVYYKVI